MTLFAGVIERVMTMVCPAKVSRQAVCLAKRCVSPSGVSRQVVWDVRMSSTKRITTLAKTPLCVRMLPNDGNDEGFESSWKTLH